MNQALAIIPARGGSKRIPRKNIKPFFGKPVIAYAIEAALQSGCFAEVMVSTDDDEIAQIALEYGAKVPFRRSAANSDDHATTVAVLLEVLAGYKALGTDFAEACCIYPLNPFLDGEKLDAARQKMHGEKLDGVFTAVRYGHPVQRAFKLTDHSIRLLFPEYMHTRTQDLEPTFHDAAQFYWFRPQVLRQTQKLFTDHTGILEIPETEVQDIDSMTDWELAEIKYKRWQTKEK